MSSKFSFDKPFLKIFGEMNDKLDEMIDSVRKYKATGDDYSVCNVSYKMRYITPQNISEYIELLAKAMYKEMLTTPGDIDRFSVECAKRFMKQNECDSFVSAVPLGYTPDPMTYRTLKDIIVGLKHDCYNKSCYSKYDMSQRSEHVKKDLKKITDMKFYVSMKNLVNGIPGVVDTTWNDKKTGHLPEMEVFREAVEAFIMFAFAVNTITVSQMHDYLYTDRTVNIKHDDANNVVLTECALLKTGETNLRLNLPFNINFRNIALSNVDSNFKELRNAVHYVLHDPSSPVNQMVLRFATVKNFGDGSLAGDHCVIERVLRPFDGCIKICGCHDKLDEQKEINDHIMKEPNEDISWLDQLAYGNQFIDASYRTDKQSTGNVTQSPLTATLDMLFKIYNGCGCGLTSNEEIANNIKHVEAGINHILCKVDQGYFESPDIPRDILALLGEIMTRDIIMLVNNNTQVIDASSFTTENNGTPAYLYNEYSFDEFIEEDEYVMEADNNPNNAPQPTQQKKETPTVTVTQDGKSIKDLIIRFRQWILKVVAKIFDKFTKDHKLEMDYYNKHKALNEEIGKALDGDFTININKFPDYNVKWDLINPEKISQHVNDWLKVDDTHKEFNEDAFLMGLLPGDERMKESIVAEKNPTEKQNKIKNVILYSQIGTPDLITSKLDSEIWRDKICDPYEKSGTLIERYTKALAEQFNLAADAVEKKLQNNGEVEANDKNQAAIAESERAKQISNVLTKYNYLFITNPINVVMKDFYSTLYTTYASIVKAYKMMNKKTQNNDNQNPPEATGNKEEEKK